MPSPSFPALPDRRPLLLTELALPAPQSIVVLAPHPDDFDAIGVSLRLLHAQGHEIHLAVLTAGAGGIEDGWSGARDADAKAAIREKEQRASCRFFGLPMERLAFLRLWEDSDDSAAGQASEDRLRSYLLARRPQIVFLPHGNDSNRTHRRTYESFCAIARQEGLQVQAFLNLDAKTLAMRPDLYMFFGEEEAAWKGELLRLHRSQHERNLKARGHGFDERVLKVNREAAAAAGSSAPYAEVFELQRFG